MLCYIILDYTIPIILNYSILQPKTLFQFARRLIDFVRPQNPTDARRGQGAQATADSQVPALS